MGTGPGLSHVAAQRAVRGHEDVQAQVELPPADQQRVVDVQRDHVGFLRGLRHKPKRGRESRNQAAKTKGEFSQLVTSSREVRKQG